MPSKIRGHAGVEIGGDLYTFGGYSGIYSQSSIQRLSCSSQVCIWTTINQQLKVARGNAVAIPVMDALCTQNFPGETIDQGGGNCACPGDTVKNGVSCNCPGETLNDGAGNCACPGDTVKDGTGNCECPDNQIPDSMNPNLCLCLNGQYPNITRQCGN